MNKVTFNLEDHKKLHAYLTEKGIGTELKMGLTATLEELDEKVAVFGLKSAQLPGYKPDVKAEDGGESIADQWSRTKAMEMEPMGM